MKLSTVDTAAVRQVSRTVVRFEVNAQNRPEMCLPSNEMGIGVRNAAGNWVGNRVGNRASNRAGNAVYKK